MLLELVESVVNNDVWVLGAVAGDQVVTVGLQSAGAELVVSLRSLV